MDGKSDSGWGKLAVCVWGDILRVASTGLYFSSSCRCRYLPAVQTHKRFIAVAARYSGPFVVLISLFQ